TSPPYFRLVVEERPAFSRPFHCMRRQSDTACDSLQVQKWVFFVAPLSRVVGFKGLSWLASFPESGLGERFFRVSRPSFRVASNQSNAGGRHDETGNFRAIGGRRACRADGRRSSRLAARRWQ